jgi:hypothetical protein
LWPLSLRFLHRSGAGFNPRLVRSIFIPSGNRSLSKSAASHLVLTNDFKRAKTPAEILLAAGTNRNIPVTLDFGGAVITYGLSFSSQMRMAGYHNPMLTTNPRQFHIEAVAGNGNALNIHLVISRRWCELALALLAGSLRESVSQQLAAK